MVKQETATPAPAVKSSRKCKSSFSYHCGRRNQPERCRSYGEQLKAKGFAEAKALNTDGKVRVSISSFNNANEATKQLLELRKNETYKNAWLLAK